MALAAGQTRAGFGGTCSTAASFLSHSVALHIGGADKLLPPTFLVIIGTVAIYGLAATLSRSKK